MPRQMGPKVKFEKGEAVKLFKRYFKMTLGQHPVLLVLVVICIATTAIVGAQGTLFLKDLINNYITPMVEKTIPVDLHALAMRCVKMICVFSIGIFSSTGQAIIMRFIANDALLTMRMQMFSHMQALPIRYFDRKTHGEIMSHYSNDVDSLFQLTSQSLPQATSSIFSIVVILVSMFTLNWALTLIILVAYFLIMFLVKKISNKASTGFKAQHASVAKLNGFIEEYITGQKVVKVFCHEKKAIADFKEFNDELQKNAFAANRNGNILMPMMNNLGHFVYAIIAIVGSVLSIKQVIPLDLGTIAAFLQFTRSFSQPISMVSQQLGSVISGLAGIKRICVLLDEKEEEDSGDVILVDAKHDENGQLVETPHFEELWAWKVPTENGFDLVEVKGDVRFDHVTFGYNENKVILKDISLYAKPGQKIAFVGHTGAGKTTITNLINRFYDINEGVITVDGIDINRIKKASLRHSMAMVLQDTSLFTGTIRDNIKFGRLNASDEDVIEAAKQANAHDFITKLKDGYDTVLTNNGANLSQGQRQLLSIARAKAANHPILVLDEATSSIDTRTEFLINNSMDKLMQNRTVLVIAHRLSTVRDAKAIMVIDDGKIIERGSHDDLLKEKGMYYELYTGASELE